MDLLRGRAPYFLSKPFSHKKLSALVDILMSYPKSLVLFTRVCNSILIIFFKSSFSKLLNITISSTLFKNSGEKAFFKDFSIVPLIFFDSCDLTASVPKPTPFPKSLTFLAPRF